MNTVILSPPAAEPLELEDVKAFMRISSSEEDQPLLDLIVSARMFFEKETGFALINRTIRANLRFFPKASTIRLPYPPLVSVTSVEYYDSASPTALVSGTDFYVDNTSRLGSLVLVPGQSWPTDDLRPPGVEIEYIAGFGAFSESIPGDILQCLRSLIAFWDDVPEAVYVPGDTKISGKIEIMPMGALSVIERYKKEARG